MVGGAHDVYRLHQPRVEATEADYNRWYDTKHRHGVVRIKGVVAATGYKLAHSNPARCHRPEPEAPNRPEA